MNWVQGRGWSAACCAAICQTNSCGPSQVTPSYTDLLAAMLAGRRCGGFSPHRRSCKGRLENLANSGERRYFNCPVMANHCDCEAHLASTIRTSPRRVTDPIVARGWEGCGCEMGWGAQLTCV